MVENRAARPGGRAAVLWLPGLAVALGAAVATAHGLFEVAVAARVPGGIAWLYPLITDGLALVAYGATARLRGSAAGYAWTVVVTAAGLSGLGQATYLAGGPTVEVAPALRFGVGAWPAVAAAVVAHLLYLLAVDQPPRDVHRVTVQPGSVQPGSFNAPDVQPNTLAGAVQLGPGAPGGPDHPEGDGDDAAGGPPPRPVASPARDRAETAAARHAQRHGAWPTVTELETAAEVSRGTAAAALKALRDRPLPLRLINTAETDPTDTTDEAHP
ncbi:hypothetical protein Acsp06_54150 [Actinomycetospora sp. NBRC 106375]|uniref:hypothetical protein n=1 Tax=Actinomycetospora sp. NBRC 106375 TaxID=3032207 RepID=UPI0024A2E5A2|nr:hypothetical protein [Actinomycetospora sp. NBRC 106375]GLZ49230.1 hypothetical protein Acsp06_54150 [Actinomycetospora sp. NBRC 106375]